MLQTLSLSILLWSIINGDLPTSVYGAVENQKDVLEEYYNSLEKIAPKSTSEQIASLQQFLQRHGQFERVYLKLLETYVYDDRLQEGKAYFQNLVSNPAYSPNSHWMLAKIFLLENNFQLALQAFREALLFRSPSIRLLKDLANALHQHPERLDQTGVLHELGLNPQSQKIASVFLRYLNSDYRETINRILKLPKNVLHNEMIIHTLGWSYHRLSRFALADSIWRGGLSNTRTDGDLESKIKFLANLAISSNLLHRYDQAISYSDSADAIASRLSDFGRKQLLLGIRGFIDRNRGNYSEAIKNFSTAIKIASRMKSYELPAWYLGYGQSLYFLEQFNGALQAFDESLKGALKVRHKRWIVEINLAKSNLYIYLKQFELAKKVAKEVEEHAKKAGLTTYQHLAEVSLANIMHQEGLYSEARESYRKFLNDSQNRTDLIQRAYWLYKLADSYKLDEIFDQAEKEYLRAIATASDAGSEIYVAWYQREFADLKVITGEQEEARELYQIVIKSARAFNNSDLLSQAYHGLGNVYKNESDFSTAILVYKQAADILEDTRANLKVDQLRIGYFSERSKIYESLVYCYYRQFENTGDNNHLDSLFYYTEMGKSRTLQELKAGIGLSVKNDKYQLACNRLRKIQRELRQNFAKNEELLSLHEAARYSLVGQRLRLAEERSSDGTRPSQVPPLSNVLDHLRQSELGLLLYTISDDTSFVLISNRDEVKIVGLQFSPTDLVAAIDSLVAPMHNVRNEQMQSIPFRAAIAHRLYQWLIEPAEEVLKLPSQLVIVPDLELMNLPFELLLSQSAQKRQYTPSDAPNYAKHFLVHRYTITYSPYTTLLMEPATAVKNSNILIFANPFGRNSLLSDKQNDLFLRADFEPLPFSELEAERIRNVHPDATIYKRENATKASFMQMAPRHQIVHISTHAFVDAEFDMFSGFTLAAGSDSLDDGMMMGYEISDLNLDCDLVTLSACETGRGKVVAGEGVLGLPRLFLGAGAKTVLMTHWKVDDKFTSELMPEFYGYYLKDGLSKADALANAKINILQGEGKSANGYYQHPFFWASFTLYGDPGAKRESSSLVQTMVLGLVLLMGTYFWLQRRSKRI